MNEPRDDLEARIVRIERFLDIELRERQHLTYHSSPFQHGPLNPFYGCTGPQSALSLPAGLRSAIIGESPRPMAVTLMSESQPLPAAPEKTGAGS